MVFGIKRKKNVHINVDRGFFKKFIERPRKVMQRKLGVPVTVPRLTRLLAKQGDLRLRKKFKGGY